MTNGKKVPTIFDVAELSGVSISTISRVINTPEKVNLNTRQRVYEAIDKLGFVPQAEARARALRLKGRIGVITPFFTAPSFVQRLRGIAGSLSKDVVHRFHIAFHVENIGFCAIFRPNYPDAFFQLVNQFENDVFWICQIAKGSRSGRTGG